MSRGLGRVERDVLAYMRKEMDLPLYRDGGPHPFRLDSLASGTGHHPESVRRAIKSLARKELVTLGWTNGWRVLDYGDRLVADQHPGGVSPTATLVSVGDCSTLNARDADPRQAGAAIDELRRALGGG